MTPGSRIIIPPTPVTAKAHCYDEADIGADGDAHIRYAFGHWAFVLVRTGDGVASIGGRRFPLRPGTLVCAPPGLVAVDINCNAELFVVTLEERHDSPLKTWQPFSVPIVRQLSVADTDEWTRRMIQAEHRIAHGVFDDTDVIALKIAFSESFWLAPKSAARKVVHSTFHTLHEEVEHIASLDVLAADIGYTRNHLSDVMRDLTGVALGAWLTGTRMARARKLLVEDDMPIADIGAASGYGDAAYFSRAFRRSHGVPPYAWRLAHRPNDERQHLFVSHELPA